jgi:glutamyl-Q tRNA(Asp) synthetase
MGLLYPCGCSRAEIAARAVGTDPDGAPLYDGHCRRHAPDGTGPVAWRLRMDEAIARAGQTYIREHPVSDTAVKLNETTTRAAAPERWGDVVLVRKETPTSYHLSVVIDDAAQGVTHVTRGMDLYPSTDIHVLLQALLGLPSPSYAHHGLITDALDTKLSKSAGAPALRLLREAGWTPQQVRVRLGFAP